MDARSRFKKAMAVKEAYSDFLPFLLESMKFLTFDLTWMQADIGEFLQKGPQQRAVFAQRGQAKSTITCLYALWRLTQNPATRVLIVGANGTRATENCILMHRLIHTWDLLDYLRPDQRHGDRTGNDSFDVHYLLKGIDKSPSVKGVGITSGFTGSRADVLIADDIEIPENSGTPVQRAKLLNGAREFSAVCTHGEIIYLGTPQTKDSIYNNLASFGVVIRIWPGRYPSTDHIQAYGERLAPSILTKMERYKNYSTGGGLDGTRGKPTDPKMLDEETLNRKEQAGPEYFELQYMLNTKLMDDMRQQLKLRDLVILEANNRVPEVIDWAPNPVNQIKLDPDFPVVGATIFSPGFMSKEFTNLQRKVMTVDPASTGGDEVAFACGGVNGPYIHVTDWGGLKGGMSADNMTKLLDIAAENEVELIILERNFGGGIATSLLQGHARQVGSNIGITDKPAGNVQKEKRIIDCIAPIQLRHRLVMHKKAIDRDIDTIKVHPRDRRMVYSGLFQMDSLTTDAGCLNKDDRIDVLAQLCKQLSDSLREDEHRAAEVRREGEIKEFFDNPTGNPYKSRSKQAGRGPAYLKRRFGELR